MNKIDSTPLKQYHLINIMTREVISKVNLTVFEFSMKNYALGLNNSKFRYV